MMFLEGVRVLDLSRVLAGPMATQTLADMGAEVLKIESPTGDDTRHWGPPFKGDMAAYFTSCNRNKASLVLDLKKPEDQARLERLVAVADVVVDNYPPEVRKRLGVTPNRLMSIKPDLVIASITGYRGSRENEPGYDIMIQAESGLMDITGPEDGSPYKTGVAIVDVLTGLMTANGILAALVRRLRTGRGASLTVSLYQTALLSLVNVAANYLVSGKPASRWGNAHANIVPYQNFQAADRQVIIGAGNDRQFQRLCGVLGIEEPAFVNMGNAARVMARKDVIERLSSKVETWTSDELLDELKKVQIPCAPILNPAEALMRVKSWDPESIIAFDHSQLGEMHGVNASIVSDGMRVTHTAPPQLDELGRVTEQRWLANKRG